jgi:hypothetical protein
VPSPQQYPAGASQLPPQQTTESAEAASATPALEGASAEQDINPTSAAQINKVFVSFLMKVV